VSRIEDRDGRVIEEFGPAEAEVALKPDVAYTLLDSMRGVINRGTGRAIRSRYGIRADVAGKTGTTQDNADGWFILMHPATRRRRLGRLQRQPRHAAQRPLGAGRAQRPAGRRRLLPQRPARPHHRSTAAFHGAGRDGLVGAHQALVARPVRAGAGRRARAAPPRRTRAEAGGAR
jgi:hypothetical protein